MEQQLNLPFENSKDLYYVKDDGASSLKVNIPNTILFRCECGQELALEFKNWEVNIVGAIQVRCPHCGNIITTPGVWSNDKEE